MLSTEFTNMVRKLAKSGVHICYSLDGQKAHDWHMATGIAGECGEFLECAYKLTLTSELDVENAIEELGDVHFYLQGLFNANPKLIPPSEYQPSYELSSKRTLLEMAIELSISGAAILDAVKKVCVYGKTFGESVTGELELQKDIDKLIGIICDIYGLLGLTHDQVLEANMNKLLKGDNARYANGTYSDQQAQARADKA